MSEQEIKVKWWVERALKDHKSAVLVATGGVGAGKTRGFACIHHDRVEINSESRFSLFFEPTHSLVAKSAVPLYEDHLRSLGYVHGKHFKITRSPNFTIKYLIGKAKHEVHFGSFDRPELIVAVNASHATIDECADATREAYTNTRRRVRCPNANVLQTLLGGAPQGINWFAEEFDSETLEGWDTTNSRDHIHAAHNYRRFIIWTDENMDNLPDSYLDDLMIDYRHNPGLVQSYRFGRFSPLTLRAAYSNYRSYTDIEDIEADPQRDLNLTFDFNANPVTWLSCQRIPFNDGYERVFKYVWIHESDESPGASQLSDAVVEFAAKHPVFLFRNTPIKLYGDRSGHAKSHKIDGSDFDNIKRYLEELGYTNVEICAARQVAPEAESVEAVQKLFMNNQTVLCKRMKGLRRSFLATEWQDGKRKLDKPKNDSWTHKGDACKYFCWQVTRDDDGTGRSQRIHGTNKL